jgi:drug/metabolite transporter (DMT)-like permease
VATKAPGLQHLVGGRRRPGTDLERSCQRAHRGEQRIRFSRPLAALTEDGPLAYEMAIATSSAVSLASASAPASTGLVKRVAGFAVIYVVWGSTFLGIRVAVESLPPLAMATFRFLVSGGILWLVSAGARPRPTVKQWRNAACVGALFFLGNHGLVTVAARYLPSSLVCLIVATEVPIITLLSSAFLPNQPLKPRSLVGAALGVVGVAWLFVGRGLGMEAAPLLPSLAVLGASVSWSLGAVFSRKLEFPPNPLLRSSMQMLCGGAMLAVGSVVKGELPALRPELVTARSLWALAYLIGLGSVVAFAVYTWLLGRVRVDAVATHAFVNPLVAVLLGTYLGGERMLPTYWVAGAFILCSVWVITIGFPQRRVSPTG